DLVDPQVRLGRRGGADAVGGVGHADERRAEVGLGVDGGAAEPHAPGGAEDPHGDLAPVGDEDGGNVVRVVVGSHRDLYIRMTTVNFGTTEQETAVTILAPSLAMPPASTSAPTMNPEMFWRNTSGILRWLQSSMKWAALSDDSENRMPLLATIPTGKPMMWAKPQTIVVP